MPSMLVLRSVPDVGSVTHISESEIRACWRFVWLGRGEIDS